MNFKDCIVKSHPTGSRYICNPPVVGTDNDTVILVNGYYEWGDLLIKEGWNRSFGVYIGSTFESWVKGEENYIITEDDAFYIAYVHATEGAKALNLLDKQDRIKLFSAIVDTIELEEDMYLDEDDYDEDDDDFDFEDGEYDEDDEAFNENEGNVIVPM